MLKFVLEIGPLILFFFANAQGEKLIEKFSFLAFFDQAIFLATAVFMVAITLSLALSWALMRKIPVMPLISGIIVLVFGMLTLLLQDALFIKLKPTIVNLLFAAILFAGLRRERPLLSYIFDGALQLTRQGWIILSRRWGFFFLFLAVLNEIIWRNFSTDFWVSFKLFGMMPITIIFTITQIPFISRNSVEADSKQQAADASGR